MSTTKTFTNIKSGKRHQIDATARGYYDFRTTVVPQPNKPLSFDMRVYDGLNYAVDLSKNSVRAGEINFDGTILPYLENNTLEKINYCFGNSGTNYDLPIYEEIYNNITKVGNVSINNGIASNFSSSNYLDLGNLDFSGDYEIILKLKMPETDSDTANYKPFFDAKTNAHFYIGLSNYVNGNRYIHSDSGDGSNWYTGINGTTSLELNTEYYIKISRSGTTRTMHLSTDNTTWSEEGSVEDIYAYNAEYCLGAVSYLQSSDIFKGSFDLKESKITIGENIINLGDHSLQKQYTGYTLEGNASINGSVCSGFNSSGKVVLNGVNFTNEKDIIIGFTTESDVVTAQKIFEYQDDGISFQIVDGKIQYWTKDTRLWHDYETVEPNNSYKLKIIITGNTSYTLGFMNVNDLSYNNTIEVTDSGLTVGKNLTFYIGTNSDSFEKPFQGTIDIREIPGAYEVKTEFKPGIFYNHEDAGSATELNCFSKSNEFVVLSPDENIIDHTWLGKVNIPEHKISWNEPSTPDEPTVDPSALKFGDRIDNKATIVGTFESNDGKKYAFAVLDSAYYGQHNWASGLNGTDTGLPNYATEDEVLVAKESATYNTDYILNNYSDKETEAFAYCRSIEPLNFNGKIYNCQLPNAYELKQIYNNSEKLYELDPTTSTNASYNLANWEFNGVSDVWSSNECNSDSSWELQSVGVPYNYTKNGPLGVIPIIEIPLSK